MSSNFFEEVLMAHSTTVVLNVLYVSLTNFFPSIILSKTNCIDIRLTRCIGFTIVMTTIVLLPSYTIIFVAMSRQYEACFYALPLMLRVFLVSLFSLRNPIWLAAYFIFARKILGLPKRNITSSALLVFLLGIGFILPPLRYLLFGMPPLFPIGIAMAFEMAAYGLVVGLLYSRSRWKCIFSLYRSMMVAMIAGRIVWGVARALLTGVAGEAFTWQLFMAGAFLNAIPGIVLQLVFIPAIMVALNRAGLVHFSRKPQMAETASAS